MTKKITEDQEQRAERLADWAERLDDLPESAKVTKSTAPGRGRSLMEAVLGSPEAVAEAISVGRPALDGGRGKSPVRQVRLPRDLDALLVERATAENRTPSEVVREAIAAYVNAS